MKKLITIFIFQIFVACYIGLSCKQPVQLTFENLTDLQKKVHYFLCRQATQVDHGRQTNYFTAALVFYFQDNTQPSSPLQPLVLWFSSGKVKESNIQTNGCFVSGQINRNDQNTFNDLHKTLNKDFDESWTSLNRYTSRNILGTTQEEKKLSQFRLVDSEMQFLHTVTFISKMMTNQYIIQIQKEIKTYLGTNSNLQLQRIELHGFTTRDMCPCCFQHMQNFLIQANTQQTNKNTFFGNLLTQLNQENIPVSFFISSLVELGNQEYKCSRYPSYRISCKEKIATASTPSEKTMHCIFLRESEAPLLSLNSQNIEQSSVISNANTIFSKNEEIRRKNLKPGVEQMQLGEFILKKDLECKEIIMKIGLGDINLGTQPVSQSPETLTIAGQQFRLYDVPRDGNCGVWAFLQARNPSDRINPTEERINNMLKTRQVVAKLAANDTKKRIGTAGNWLSTDDFRYFAQYANQDIVVIIDNGNGNYQYETYTANGIAYAAVDGLPTEYSPINNRLYIYYRNGHFQTLLLEPSMKRGGEAIQGIGNWEDWEDSDEK